MKMNKPTGLTTAISKLNDGHAPVEQPMAVKESIEFPNHPQAGQAVYIETTRFFYLARFLGPSDDGASWWFENVAVIVMLGTPSGMSTKGASGMEAFDVYALPAMSMAKASVTMWAPWPHSLPDKGSL